MNNFDDLFNNSTPAKTPNEDGKLSKEEYAAKKKAERDVVFQLSDRAAKDVSHDGDVFQSYLDVQSNFDRYSEVNALLILAQNHEATQLGDFEHWKSLGGFIKRGETSISIIAPGKEYTRDDGGVSVAYDVKKVFDISQVDKRNVKLPPKPKHTEREILAALVKSSPLAVVGVQNLSERVGAMRNGDRIEVRSGMGFADAFRALAQEIAHANLADGTSDPINAQFSAYSAAYILCKKYGVDAQDFNFAAAPDVLRDLGVRGVKGELSKIREAAGDILGRMAKQLNAPQKAAKAQEAR